MLMLLAFVSSAFYIFRRKKVYFHEDQVTTTGTVFAPVSGKVVRVSEGNTKSITIRMNILDELGIYLPCTSEIKNLNFHSDYSSFRFSSLNLDSSEVGTVLELSDKKKRVISLQFIRFVTGRLPELVILPGDRGRRQVNIGYFPYGGFVILNLPEESEIVVKEGDRLVATEAIVARFKNEE